MQFTRITLAVAVALVPTLATAHFPFLHVESDSSTRTLHAYFGHGVEPTPTRYFARLEGAEVWRLTPGGKPTPLSLTPADASLASGPIPDEPAAFLFIKDQGVATYNGPNLLTNYAKAFSGPEAWPVDSSKLLRLDITPVRRGNELQLTVRWNGVPLADADVVVDHGKEKQEGKADAEGRFSAKLTGSGVYAIRTWRVDATPGVRDGVKYESVRHYSTLTLDVK